MRYVYRDVARDSNGIVLRSATVNVYLAGTTTAATVYTSVTSTTGVNSVTTDTTDGSFTFYIDAFDYGSYQKFKFILSKPSLSDDTFTVDEVSVDEVVTGTYTISTAKTISYPVFIPYGVIFSKSGAGSINFNASTEIGLYQVFDSNFSSGITFGIRVIDEIYPEWWGAKADGVTESAPGIDRAVQSLSAGTVKLSTGTYLLSTVSTAPNAEVGRDYIVPKSNVNIIGEGAGSILKVKDGQNPSVYWNIIYSAASYTNVIFRDFTIDGNGQNNLLTSGDTARVNTFIGGLGAGTDILIENITFKNNPGNQTVAYGGSTGKRITVKNCRFQTMANAITGNYNTDHTDIYLTGSYNKIIDNWISSEDTGVVVNGAGFEFHGPYGEAYGNYVGGYKTSSWVAMDVDFIGTQTDIHDNKFLNVYQGVGLSPISGGTNTYSFGLISIYNNTFKLHASANYTYVLSGSSSTTNQLDEYNVFNNKIYAVAGYTAVINAGYARAIRIENNYIYGPASYGIVIPSAGGYDGTYTAFDVSIKGNVIDQYTTYGIHAATASAKFKTLTIIDNQFLGNTGTPSTIAIASGATTSGYIGNNTIDSNNTYAVFFSTSGMSTVLIDQKGSDGKTYVRYNAASATGLNWEKYDTAAPTTGANTIGDRVINSVPTVGQPKAWVCTVTATPGTWVSEGNL